MTAKPTVVRRKRQRFYVKAAAAHKTQQAKQQPLQPDEHTEAQRDGRRVFRLTARPKLYHGKKLE